MCTRLFNNRSVVYPSTARNMDWATQFPTSMYYFKKGQGKIGIDDPGDAHALTWYSLYDSVVVMVGNEAHGLAASDGMNDRGLVANVLYDKNSTSWGYEGRRHLSVLRWVQYVVDMFETVEEVNDAFKDDKIGLVIEDVPGGNGAKATLHMSVSDAKGGSLIMEVYDGVIHRHLSPSYAIMTNDPNFDDQLKLNEYWLYQWRDDELASRTIPGGPFSPNRFERGVCYYNRLNAPFSSRESLAQSQGVLATVSVPVGFIGPESHPNISATIWTTLANQARGEYTYYFSNARTVNTIWFDFDAQPEDTTAKLELVEYIGGDSEEDVKNDKNYINKTYEGCINGLMEVAQDPYLAIK